MYNIKSIADWILQNIEDVSNKKMQKLLYYTYAWYLTVSNDSVDDLQDKLFVADFEAWVHGPVNRQMYNSLRGHNWCSINKDFYEEYRVEFDQDTLELLNQVKDVYGSFTGNQLEYISHQEEPWRKARATCSDSELCNNVISDESMYEYYSSVD